MVLCGVDVEVVGVVFYFVYVVVSVDLYVCCLVFVY